MASLKQVRQRIRSTQNTRQIMRAMQLVSASKLKRAQARLQASRELMGFLDGLLRRVLAAAPALKHPLCEGRASAGEALVIVTSDAGLCGAYNANLIALAETALRGEVQPAPQVIYVGRKGYRYFTTRGYPAAGAYLNLAGRPSPRQIEEMGRALMDRFLGGHVGAVTLVFPEYVSLTTCRPTICPWLPVSLAGLSGEVPEARQREGRPLRASDEYLFEPSPERVFADLLPRWAVAAFQQIVLEAFASEHAARMVAMKNATENAEELLRLLTQQRNKVRQAAITKEISEIVGTAEALK